MNERIVAIVASGLAAKREAFRARQRPDASVGTSVI
jgi:hypothetical protein